MDNYDKKIKKIKEREKELLEYVRYYVYIDSRSFKKCAKEVIEKLDYNNKTGKKYIAVVNAQKSIKKYAKQIIEAKDAEEVKEIRKKLNKSINLIKEEMKKRDIDEETYNKYCESAKHFRKRIAENVRYLKRKEKIKEIKKLNKHIKDLNKDDLKRLRKLVKNELEYGKRNLSKYDEFLDDDIDLSKMNFGKVEPEEDDITYYVLQKEDLEEAEQEEKVELIEEVKDKKKDKKHKKDKSKKEKKKEMIEVVEKKEKDNKETITLKRDVLGTIVKKEEPVFQCKYRYVEDYIEDKVEDFQEYYHIDRIDEYTGGLIKNLRIFRGNYSKMLSNKEKSKSMIADCESGKDSPELRGYSDYVRKHNSVLHNIKEAMTTNVFRCKESMYDEELYNSINWIVNYCKNNKMEITYQKTLGSN